MHGHTSVYGIIGYPVTHSLSPQMHNTAFRELGVDAVYKLFSVPPENLADFFSELRQKDSDIFGLNVTIPYKETVVPFMDSLNPFAQKAMAVNTVVISPQKALTGINTDGPGFLTHLAELGFNTKNKRISMIGAGGTTRAILSALCLIPERPYSIHIYNRHQEKTDELLRDLGQRFELDFVQSVETVDDLHLELADLLINTTPLGMKPDDPLLIDEELLHQNMLVYDVVYSPSPTKLLKMAQAKGAKVADGLGLLYYQGVLSFQHWAGLELDAKIKSKMRETLTLAKKGR